MYFSINKTKKKNPTGKTHNKKKILKLITIKTNSIEND